MKKWNEDQVMAVFVEDDDDNIEEEVTGWKTVQGEDHRPREGEQLSEDQRRQLRNLLEQFSDVFKNE